ncbi:MAG TPA: aspartate aminotransferase family protein [Candidatus Tumulicola sp.]|nr:aspartate aminotransferase family protein [Candidatus Tumulicola sp.]
MKELTGKDLAHVVVEPPGPRSRELAKRLRECECRDVTYVSDDFPVFFERGTGANLVDVDGNVYVDLSGAFGVAAAGHSNPRVVEALAHQAGRLLHGMGDVHPTEGKVLLAEALCEVTPGKGSKRVILASSGAEAVESAIKTAAIATGKPGVISFTGAYHGLTYGALALTDRDHFREPFVKQLGSFARRVPYAYCYRCPLNLTYPECETACLSFVEEVLDAEGGGEIGAVIVEPIQGRGGEVPAPLGWLADLRELCDRRRLLLIADEIFTGFGRTGRWFACDHAGVVPDLICVGKGMSSGFPISACIGKAEVMDRWPECTGEAIHTSTFLGHPTGCAAALASIQELREHKLVERAAALEKPLGAMLNAIRDRAGGRIGDVRGKGLMWGLECVDEAGEPASKIAAQTVAGALRRGVVLLAGGPANNVLSFTPPLVIEKEQLEFALGIVAEALIEA